MKDQHNEPVTKGDVAELQQEVAQIDRKVEHLDQKMNRVEKSLHQFTLDLGVFKEEMNHHFMEIVEDLRDNFGRARSDEIESLKDGKADHERRIRRLEKSTGLVAA